MVFSESELTEKIAGSQLKMTALHSKYETLKSNLELFEQERNSILFDIRNSYFATGNEEKNEEYMKLYETIKVALEGFKLVLEQNPPKDKEPNKPKKCRYHNRGFCKFKEECMFSHSTRICEEYTNNGICKLSKCDSRHPKHCRYWCKRVEGCKRQNDCQYLHLASTRFTWYTEISNGDDAKGITTEDANLKTNTNNIINNNTCDQCKYKITAIGNLKTHTESNQEESSYPCNSSNNTADNRIDLRTHIESEHKESCYHCELTKTCIEESHDKLVM